MLNSYMTKVTSPKKPIHMNIGTVKWYDRARGFGFMRPDDGGNDVYFHATSLPGQDGGKIQIGDRLSFVWGTNPKNGRPAAVECKPAS